MEMKIIVPLMILMAIFIASVDLSTAQGINPDQLREQISPDHIIVGREIHPVDQDIIAHSIGDVSRKDVARKGGLAVSRNRQHNMLAERQLEELPSSEEVLKKI